MDTLRLGAGVRGGLAGEIGRACDRCAFNTTAAESARDTPVTTASHWLASLARLLLIHNPSPMARRTSRDDEFAAERARLRESVRL